MSDVSRPVMIVLPDKWRVSSGRCLVSVTRHTNTTTLWGSLWTADWRSWAPRACLSSDWETTTPSECRSPAVASRRTIVHTEPHPVMSYHLADVCPSIVLEHACEIGFSLLVYRPSFQYRLANFDTVTVNCVCRDREPRGLHHSRPRAPILLRNYFFIQVNRCRPLAKPDVIRALA